MANRLFTSQFISSFEKQLVELVGAFTITKRVKATLVNQALTYTAVAYGTTGNSITIRLVDPAAPSSALSISVVGSAISVSLATDGGSAITTTATELKNAINADVDASALVLVTGAGASALSALVATHLTGGVDFAAAGNLPIAFMTLSQTDVGLYELLLADKYPALLSAQIMLQSASVEDLQIQISSEDVNNAKTIDFRSFAIGSGIPVLTDIADTDVIYVDLKLRNVN